jgi:hypothetical protein
MPNQTRCGLAGSSPLPIDAFTDERQVAERAQFSQCNQARHAAAIDDQLLQR